MIQPTRAELAPIVNFRVFKNSSQRVGLAAFVDGLLQREGFDHGQVFRIFKSLESDQAKAEELLGGLLEYAREFAEEERLVAG